MQVDDLPHGIRLKQNGSLIEVYDADDWTLGGIWMRGGEIQVDFSEIADDTIDVPTVAAGVRMLQHIEAVIEAGGDTDQLIRTLTALTAKES